MIKDLLGDGCAPRETRGVPGAQSYPVFPAAVAWQPLEYQPFRIWPRFSRKWQ